MNRKKNAVPVIGFCAWSGTGKTTLMEHIAKAAIENPDRDSAVIVIDPHGDMFNRLIGCVPRERINDVILLDFGDPDYVVDKLTEKGIKEAEALNRLIPQLNVGDCYVSPLGRAQKTAELALKGTGLVPEQLEWLQEFMTD